MSARDDYPLIGVDSLSDCDLDAYGRMCDEIDRLRSAADAKFREAVAKHENDRLSEANNALSIAHDYLVGLRLVQQSEIDGLRKVLAAVRALTAPART